MLKIHAASKADSGTPGSAFFLQKKPAPFLVPEETYSSFLRLSIATDLDTIDVTSLVLSVFPTGSLFV